VQNSLPPPTDRSAPTLNRARRHPTVPRHSICVLRPRGILVHAYICMYVWVLLCFLFFVKLFSPVFVVTPTGTYPFLVCQYIRSLCSVVCNARLGRPSKCFPLQTRPRYIYPPAIFFLFFAGAPQPSTSGTCTMCGWGPNLLIFVNRCFVALLDGYVSPPRLPLVYWPADYSRPDPFSPPFFCFGFTSKS
jgi:hypothetical protein